MDAQILRVQAELEQKHWWFSARRSIVRTVVETVAPPGKGLRVLDIGCGVGALAPPFEEGYRYIGYDPSADAVKLARTRHPGLEFRVGTATTATDHLNRADVVLLADVLEHVRDDVGLLEEIVEAMPSGAWLLVTVPAGAELWSPHDVALGHYRRYDLDTLHARLAHLPVRPALLSYFNARLYPAVRAVRGLTRSRNRAAGPWGTDDVLPPALLNALLRRVFAGEAQRLTAYIGAGRSAYPRGVSALTLVERLSGPVDFSEDQRANRT